jgi:hypothetical protein
VLSGGSYLGEQGVDLLDDSLLLGEWRQRHQHLTQVADVQAMDSSAQLRSIEGATRMWGSKQPGEVP